VHQRRPQCHQQHHESGAHPCRARHKPPALGRAPRRKNDKPKLRRGMAHPVCRGGRAAPAARPVTCSLLFDA
jgi:hypothetical protein